MLCTQCTFLAIIYKKCKVGNTNKKCYKKIAYLEYMWYNLQGYTHYMV